MFIVVAAFSMDLAVTAMAGESGSGEPGGAQLRAMIEMADRLAPRGEDVTVISRIKGVTDSRGCLAVPMYQDAELASVQEGAGTPKGEPKEQYSDMISYLVADFGEMDFPAGLTLNRYREGIHKMKAAKTSGTTPSSPKTVTYSMINTIPVLIGFYSPELAVPEGYELAGIVRYDPEEEYSISMDQGMKYGTYVFGEVSVGRECEVTVNIEKARDNLALFMWRAAILVSAYLLYKNKGTLREAKELAVKEKMGDNS